VSIVKHANHIFDASLLYVSCVSAIVLVRVCFIIMANMPNIIHSMRKLRHRNRGKQLRNGDGVTRRKDFSKRMANLRVKFNHENRTAQREKQKERHTERQREKMRERQTMQKRIRRTTQRGMKMKMKMTQQIVKVLNDDYQPHGPSLGRAWDITTRGRAFKHRGEKNYQVHQNGVQKYRLNR